MSIYKSYILKEKENKFIQELESEIMEFINGYDTLESYLKDSGYSISCNVIKTAEFSRTKNIISVSTDISDLMLKYSVDGRKSNTIKVLFSTEYLADEII